VLVVQATQTWEMTLMITGLVEVEVEQLAQVQGHFQTEHPFRHSQVIQVLLRLAEEVVTESQHRGSHQLLQVI
jgi:hypothetical protein